MYHQGYRVIFGVSESARPCGEQTGILAGIRSPKITLFFTHQERLNGYDPSPVAWEATTLGYCVQEGFTA